MASIQRPGFAAFPRTIPLPLSGRGFVVAGLLGLSLIGLLPVLESSSATTTGFTVAELEAQREQLSAEVNLLENEAASYAALDYVEYQARTRLGMVEPEERIFVTVDQPPPSLERLPASYPTDDQGEGSAGVSWWQSLADLLDFD